MLHNGRERHCEWLAEFADGSRSQGEPLDHLTASGVRQCVKDPVQVGWPVEHGSLVKHILEYAVSPAE